MYQQMRDKVDYRDFPSAKKCNDKDGVTKLNFRMNQSFRLLKFSIRAESYTSMPLSCHLFQSNSFFFQIEKIYLKDE